MSDYSIDFPSGARIVASVLFVIFTVFGLGFLFGFCSAGVR